MPPSNQEIIQGIVRKYLYTRDDVVDQNEVSSIAEEIASLIVERFDGRKLNA